MVADGFGNAAVVSSVKNDVFSSAGVEPGHVLVQYNGQFVSGMSHGDVMTLLQDGALEPSVMLFVSRVRIVCILICLCMFADYCLVL